MGRHIEQVAKYLFSILLNSAQKDFKTGSLPLEATLKSLLKTLSCNIKYYMQNNQISYYVTFLYVNFLLWSSAFRVFGMPPVRVDDFIALLVFVCSIRHIKSQSKYCFRYVRLLLIVFLFFGFSLVLEFLVDMTFSYSKFTDVMQIARYLMHGYSVFYLLSTISSRQANNITYVFLVNTALISLLGLCQYYRIAPLDIISTRYYTGDSLHHLIVFTEMGQVNRIVGVFNNPNFYGVFLILCAGFVYLLTTQYKVINRIISMAVLPLVLYVAIICTGSRTAFVIFVFMFIILIIHNKVDKTMLFGLSVFGPIIFSYLFVYKEIIVVPERLSLLLGVKSIDDVQTNNSLGAARLQIWYDRVDEILTDDNVFIYGATDSIADTHLCDNIWLRIVYEFGLLGVVPMLLILYSLYTLYSQSGKIKAYGASFVVFILLFGLTADILFAEKFILLTMFILPLIGKFYYKV